MSSPALRRPNERMTSWLVWGQVSLSSIIINIIHLGACYVWHQQKGPELYELPVPEQDWYKLFPQHPSLAHEKKGGSFPVGLVSILVSWTGGHMSVHFHLSKNLWKWQRLWCIIPFFKARAHIWTQVLIQSGPVRSVLISHHNSSSTSWRQMDFLLILIRFSHKEETDPCRNLSSTAGQGPGSGFGSTVTDETWSVEAFKCDRNLSSSSTLFNFIGQQGPKTLLGNNGKVRCGSVWMRAAMMLDRLITDVNFSVEHACSYSPVVSKDGKGKHNFLVHLSYTKVRPDKATSSGWRPLVTHPHLQFCGTQDSRCHRIINLKTFNLNVAWH